MLFDDKIMSETGVDPQNLRTDMLCANHYTDTYDYITNSTLVVPLTTEMQMHLMPLVFVKHVQLIDFKNAN